MDMNRRNVLTTMGSTALISAASILATPNSAFAAEAVHNANQWMPVEPGRVFRSTQQGILIVAAGLYHINGDFRAAIVGDVDGQDRGCAAAAWSPASGISQNCFYMFVNNGQRFRIRIVDDFGRNVGTAWGINALASGSFTPDVG